MPLYDFGGNVLRSVSIALLIWTAYSENNSAYALKGSRLSPYTKIIACLRKNDISYSKLYGEINIGINGANFINLQKKFMSFEDISDNSYNIYFISDKAKKIIVNFDNIERKYSSMSEEDKNKSDYISKYVQNPKFIDPKSISSMRGGGRSVKGYASGFFVRKIVPCLPYQDIPYVVLINFEDNISLSKNRKY
jgi:hypothetical protein